MRITYKLNSLAPQVIVLAIDNTKDKNTRQLNMTMYGANTGGLVSELHLAVEAKVMLTCERGLCQ